MRVSRIVSSSILMAMVAAFSASAMANVSLKNGNFFVGFSDLSYPGGIEPKVERVYNSKSNHDGIFGYGWGSEYEVYLMISADGSVVMHENGGGAQNRFVPPGNITKTEIDKAVTDIIAAKKRTGTPMNADVEKKERTELTTNARYRNDEWEKLFNKFIDGKRVLEARKIPEGALLGSSKYSYQVLKKIKDGYLRQFDNGQVQTFDSNGRLVKITDKNGNFVALSYNPAGQLELLQDNFNRKMKFKTENGKVVKVEGDSGKWVAYKYDGHDLVGTTDSEGGVFEFKYGNSRHNLTFIKYADKSTIDIAYYDMNNCENVKKVKDRDNTTSDYTYAGDCSSGLDHATIVSVKSSDGKEISKSKYQYIEKVKADGEHYTYKLATEVDGDKTETIYNECCGLPLEITHNTDKTTFEYDTKGHVVQKSTPAELTKLEYDSKTSKVSKVVKYSKTDKSKNGVKWAQYQYDDKGNLIYAKNSESKAVKLVYDHNGRIKALVDQDKRTLKFTYNEANRPVLIEDPAVGKITVQYSNSGEIQKVDSSGGRKIAIQVTSAFQNLLDIIRPAGVTLSF